MVLPKSAAERAATIYDVARLAGVSHQTVSRLLKGHALKPSTRARVEAAIAELDYRPNSTARALATSRSFRIGALVYELHELGPSQVAQGAANAARDSGYLLDVVALDPKDDVAIAHAIGLLDQQHLAGILALAPTRRLLDAVKSVEFRVPIFIDSEPIYTGEPKTETLNTIGAKLALEHLVGLGHERIFHVAGPLEWTSAANRWLACEQFTRRRGLPTYEAAEGDWTAASGFRAASRMPLDLGITAVFAANDQMGMGVLRALAERGVRVPRDMSVVGFDDRPESGYTIPPLTTVRLDFAEQGRSSVASLVAMIEGRPPPPRSTAAQVSLVVRGSSGPPPRRKSE